jgi:tetratricopeptide (TPR) repeat protein
MKKLFYFLAIFVCPVAFPLLLSAQDSEDINSQADKEYTGKNYQKALELATQSINIKPNVRAYFIRADARYSLNDYAAATEDFTSALSNYSTYYSTDQYKGRIYYWRGMSYQQSGKYENAVSDYGSAITYNYAESKYVYWNRAISYYNLKKYKDAEEDYGRAIDRSSDSKELSSMYMYRGNCKAMTYEYTAAYGFYARAASYNPDNYEAYWNMAYYKVIEYKNEEALADYGKAIDILTRLSSPDKNKNLAFLYENEARIYRDKKQYDEALTGMNKSLLADPNYIAGYKTRAGIYWAQKKYDKAKADYSNAITLQTDKKARGDLYFDLSLKEMNIQDYKSTLEDLNKAIELSPQDGMNYWHRAIIYEYKGNYPLSIKDCAKAAEIYQKDSSSLSGLYSLRASVKEKAGDYSGAVKDYQSVLSLYPNSTNTYYMLGRLFKTKLKNDGLATANFGKAMDLAITQDKDTVTLYYIKAFTPEKNEAISGMMQLLEKSKNDKYNYTWNLHNMACLYALTGNSVKAFEYLDKSLAEGFDSYNHLLFDEDLESLMKLPQWKTIMAKYKVPQPKW